MSTGLLTLCVACALSGAAPLSREAERGRLDEVRRSIASGADVDARDRGGNTALYYAALNGHAEIVRALAEAGADVNADNDFGSTPLHVASRAGHVEVIRILAEYGADLDARNLTGGTASEIRGGSDFALNRGLLPSSTPLEKAARAGQLDAVKVLIELGAALPAREAVKQASLKGHDEIAAYITRAATERRRKQKSAPAGEAEALASAETIPLTSEYGRRFGVVVGISHYQKLDDLEGARRDAESIAAVLRTLGFDEVFELYDGQATRTRILELVGQKLRAITRKDDLAFIFFAGHGATETLPGGEKRGYLVPTEGSDRDPYVTGISMETIRDLSNRLEARHVYYAVDACYSGGLAHDSPGDVATRGANRNRSVQVLTAGLEGQQALEEGGRGVFTSYLVEGLQGEADLNGDASITASEIGWFVANQVGEATRGRQTPAYGRLDGTGEVSFRLRN